MAIHQTKQQLHTEEVKNRILEKAEEMFLSFGVENVSMKELASSLGMTTGTIYHHFESKDDVLEHISQRHAKTYLLKTEQYLNEENKVQAIKNFFADDMTTQIRQDGFIFTRHRVLRLLNPDRPNRIIDFLQKMILQAQETNQIRKDISSETAADILLSLYRESCYEYVMSEGKETYLDKIAVRTSAFLDLISIHKD